MCGCDLVTSTSLGEKHCGSDAPLHSGRESFASGERGTIGKSFSHRLFAHAEAVTNRRPRDAGVAGFSDEVTDERVGVHNRPVLTERRLHHEQHNTDIARSAVLWVPYR